MHLAIAHETASSLSLMMAYRDSVSVRNRDPVWMRAHLPFIPCCKTNPRPSLLASVDNCVGLEISKYARVGAVVSDCRALLNACLCSVAHMKSFFVLRRGLRGASSLATESVLAESWFTSLKNERRSVRFDAVGNLSMACVMALSTL